MNALDVYSEENQEITRSYYRAIFSAGLAIMRWGIVSGNMEFMEHAQILRLGDENIRPGGEDRESKAISFAILSAIEAL